MTEVQIPNALPVLSSGHHPWGSGRACAMDAVSFIMGKPEEGDAPKCIHPVLRSAFIRVNDALPDDERHKLWPLILRAMGSADRAPTDELAAHRLNVGLAVWCARQVLHLVRAQDREVCELAIVAAEQWIEDPSANAANAANAAYAAYAYAANAAAANAAYAAANAAYAAADAANDAAAYAAYAAYAAAANAAYAAANARLASLDGLITEYNRLTASTAPAVDVPWDNMLTALGAAS